GLRGQVGGQQVGEDHGAGQVGDLFVTDLPAGGGAAGHRSVLRREAAAVHRACARALGMGIRGMGSVPACPAVLPSGQLLPGYVAALRGGSRPGLAVTCVPARTPRVCRIAFHRPYSEAVRRSLTCAADGFVSAVPSGNTTVGTVCIPPFTDIT